MNNMFFSFFFTAFTVTFYHILHHLNDDNQQKNQHPVCKSIILLIPHDNTSLQSRQDASRTSLEFNTIDKVSFWDWLLNSQYLTYYVTGLNVPLF